MDDNSALNAAGAWPLWVNLNPHKEVTYQMKLGCEISSNDVNGVREFYSNVFTASINCQGTTYAAQ